ncbi:MAG: dipeptide epimerase [Myxococcota bacterium]
MLVPSVAEPSALRSSSAEDDTLAGVRIAAIEFRRFDIELREPFGIAGGAQLRAANVLVELRLSNGVSGIGEAAPFPAVNGETQAQVLAREADAQRALLGLDGRRFRRVAEAAHEALNDVPSARAGVETALFDALCRSAQLSLWSYFGGAESELLTDITIPTGDRDHAHESALCAARAGFHTLKVKVGGVPLEHDLARLGAIHEAAPTAALVLDANASLSADDALALLDALGPLRQRVELFEQPTAAEDLEGLARVEREGRVAVAADESARSANDVARLAAQRAASVVNIKIMKTGLVEAWDMIACARAHSLGLMVGGMVETELSMTTSACLAAGIGGFRFVDLDTPLFMAARPLAGGFVQSGPRLQVDHINLGHGVRVLGESPKAC